MGLRFATVDPIEFSAKRAQILLVAVCLRPIEMQNAVIPSRTLRLYWFYICFEFARPRLKSSSCCFDFACPLIRIAQGNISRIMASEHVLRVPRSDNEGEFVVVNVSSNGNSPLDLKLLATEGESPYVTTSTYELHNSVTATDH